MKNNDNDNETGKLSRENSQPQEHSNNPAEAPLVLGAAPVNRLDVEGQVAAKVEKVEADLKKYTGEMAILVENKFSLLLLITFSYIVLKAVKNEAYVSQVFQSFRESNRDQWVPEVSTLQHYEGPMRNWLRFRASEKNRTDPNLDRQFTSAFLHANPLYYLDVEESDIRALGKECGNLVQFDRNYANDALSR